MRNIQVMTDLPFKVNQFQDITDTLPSRPNDPNPMRLPTDITHISVHHSAVENGSILGYAKDHVNTRGWYHIGYHLVIKVDQVFQVNDLLTFSYHTASNNAHTIGISVSADFSKRAPTEAERNNLYAAILTVMDLFKIPVENVLGHREYPLNATSCPCIDMNQVRADIATLSIKKIQAATWQDRKNKFNRINSQINYMDGLIAKGEESGEARWALQQKELIYKIMDGQKLL